MAEIPVIPVDDEDLEDELTLIDGYREYKKDIYKNRDAINSDEL